MPVCDAPNKSVCRDLSGCFESKGPPAKRATAPTRSLPRDARLHGPVVDQRPRDRQGEQSDRPYALPKGAEHREQRTTALLHAQKAVAPLSCLSPWPNECDAKVIPQRQNSGKDCS